MSILNFTGHDINIFKENECVINERNQLMIPDKIYRPSMVIKPQGCIRSKTTQKTIGQVQLSKDLICNVNIVEYGEPIGIPANYDPNNLETMYIVSVLAAKAMNQKYGMNLKNLLIVNNTVRNQEGNIVGCTGFAKVY